MSNVYYKVRYTNQKKFTYYVLNPYTDKYGLHGRFIVIDDLNKETRWQGEGAWFICNQDEFANLAAIALVTDKRVIAKLDKLSIA